MKKCMLLLMLVITLASNAGVVQKVYYFNGFKVINHGDYQAISFPNSLITGPEGEPALPYIGVSLILPPGHAAVSVEFTGQDETSIDGVFNIFPQQGVSPLSKGPSGKFLKNEAVYALDGIYPSSPTGQLTTQYLNGFAFGQSVFTPVRYNPATGRVSYYKKVTIRVVTRQDSKSIAALSNMTSNRDLLDGVARLAQNPADMTTYPSRKSRTDDYQMLIITPTSFQNSWQNLIDLYKIRGIKALTVTKEYISSNMPGQDVPEKIRNYIIQEYQNHAVEYVLLAGDVDQIPYRGFYCYVQSGSGYEDFGIPSDLYFSALDGNWNTDGDNKWGEPGEDDLLPEVSVARMPASTTTELNHMLTKTINYQNNPVLGEMAHPILAGEHLYDNPNTEGSQYLELLIGHHEDNGYTTDGITPDNVLDKMYDEISYWSGTDLINHFNMGRTFLHHSGHANETYVFKLSNSDITDGNFSQVNGITHNYTLVYTHGCLCGSFDYSDCIAEKMVTINNFAAAFVGNSRYGWFNEGQTEGPSAHLHREFVDAMYNDGLLRIGRAHAESRTLTAPWVTAPGQWEPGAIRWCFYDCNVLGDPAMAMWTREPMTVQAAYQAALPIGVPTLAVTVTHNGAPVSHVNCVLMKNGVVHGVAATDNMGNAVINIDPPFVEPGNAQLVISGNNCLPQTFPVTVINNTGAYVVCQTRTFNDSLGNDNDQIDYNETILMSLTLKNVGSVDASYVTATLSTDDAFITLLDGTENYGTIAAGDSVTIPFGFAFHTADNIPDNHLIAFDLAVTDGTSNWPGTITAIAHAPVLTIGTMIVSDPTGNGNGRLDPNETAEVQISVNNTGSSVATGTIATLSSASGYLTLNTSQATLGNLLPGTPMTAFFVVTVSPSAPVGSIADLTCTAISGQYSASKTFYAKIGLVLEDFESGNFTHFAWTQGGNQPWVISNVEPYEGIYSAKSGTISHNQMSDLSLQMNVAADDSVSFYLKTSSESNYDFLKFFIDGTNVAEWSGETPWTQAAFAVSAGNHTFKWEYMKDGSVASGSDCAWIDYIIFPAPMPSGASVGGTVTYANTGGTPLSGLTIKLKNNGGTVVGTTTTNSYGMYSFSTVPAGNYTLEVTTTKPWSGVSAADVLLYRKHIANISLLNGIYLNSGDVNASGTLTAADVLLVKKRIAAIIPGFPTGDWLFNNLPFVVGGSNVTQNFNGIVFGDANGSYIPAGNKLLARESGDIRISEIGDATGEISVPVILSEISDLGAFQFSVTYDPSRLSWNGISDFYPGLDDVTVGSPAPGLLTFVWAAGMQGISVAQGTLFILHFTASGDGGSSLAFTDGPTPAEFTGFDGNPIVPRMINGAIGSTKALQNGNGMNIYPNPSQGQIQISVNKEAVSPVTIRVTNALGVVVFEESGIRWGSGNVHTLNLTGIPNGIYLLTLENGGDILQNKLIIRK